jgi:glucosylceramidase
MAKLNKVILFLPLILLGCKESKKIKSITTTNETRWVINENLQTEEIENTKENIIEIDTSKKAQVVDGFGGCFNELGWEALSVLPSPVKDSIIKTLFDTESGCKFNICRMPIGANDYSVDWYSHNESPSDYEMKNFTIERDMLRLIPYIKQAQRYNPNLSIWASPWCPPSWMKTNNHYACAAAEVNNLKPEKSGKEMVTQFIMEPKVLSSYALYFSKFVDAYKKENINISAVHVQNEPNSCQNFPSCVWRPEDLAIFIGDYLAPAMENKTEIWLGTIERPNPERVDTILKHPKAGQSIKGVGFQWGGKGAISYVKKTYPQLKLMQSETECGNGSNDWAAAEYTFDLLKHYFENGANSYMYWNMILDESGKSQWGWKQNSMISIDIKNKKAVYNPEFYLMKHFSSCINPGARVINLPDPNSLAFLNPNGEIILIIMNKELNEVKQNIKINNKFYSLTVPGKSINTFII